MSERAPKAKRVRFTPAVLEMHAPRTGRVERRDDISPLWLRITATGDRSFAVRARIKGRPQPIRVTYPERAHIGNLAAAREWAIGIDAKCRAGVDPREEMRAAAARQASEADETARQEFKSIAEQFLATGGKHKKNAPGWKRRTAAEYKRVIDKRFVPRWKGRTIHSITRDEIADFLVELAETAPVAANRALATLSALMNWYQRQRGSGFTSPIVRGMAPTEENARARVLSDDEIRLVWRAAGRCGTFGAIVKVLLLTGARRSEVAAMCHSQIDAEGVWGLSGEHVKNSLPLYLPLSQDTLAIIGKQAKIDKQELVFSISGAHKFQSWSRGKASLDKRIAWQLRAQQRALSQNRTVVIPEWHLHDLRRTARSLMSRAKVAPEHAERVLNHKIRGVQGTYDRHNYEDEKRDALERLACLLRQIVEGQGAKLVQFPMRSAAA